MQTDDKRIEVPTDGNRRPGDEAEPGTPQTGEGVCPVCGGEGMVAGRPCANCRGTGKIVVNVGDA